MNFAIAVRRLIQITQNYPRFMATESKSVQSTGTNPSSRIVWVDLELTGLNLETDTILEAACVITEANLDIVAEKSNIIVHQPTDVLDRMDMWGQVHHRQSGLIDAVLKSSVTLAMAEEQLLEFVGKYAEPGKCALAGNSVYMDRVFIRKYFPKFDVYLHYRIIDVSTVKELCRRWNPYLFNTAPKKTFCHRAYDDILESIQELRHYKRCMFDQNLAGDK